MKRFLFVAVWWGLCLLGLELALQLHYRVQAGDWLFRRVSLPLWEEDPVAGFRLRSGLSVAHRTPEFRTRIFTNDQGFRVSEARERFETPKPEGVERLLLLGPSFAFGWGVDHEETFLERLGERLERPGAVLELINAGVPALGPVQQLNWFREVGRGLEPDRVIQVVYGSPAVSAAYSEALRVTGSGHLVPRDASWGRRARAWAKRSGTVFYAWSVATRGRPSGGIRGGGRTLAQEEGAPDPQAESVRTSRAFYRDFARTVRDAGAEPLVVYLPLAYRVHPEDLPRWRHLGVTDPAAGAARHAALLDWIREDGVPVVDLTSELREAAAAGERQYYRVDIHWTPAGHETAAAAVARHLQGDGTADDG